MKARPNHKNTLIAIAVALAIPAGLQAQAVTAVTDATTHAGASVNQAANTAVTASTQAGTSANQAASSATQAANRGTEAATHAATNATAASSQAANAGANAGKVAAGVAAGTNAAAGVSRANGATSASVAGSQSVRGSMPGATNSLSSQEAVLVQLDSAAIVNDAKAAAFAARGRLISRIEEGMSKGRMIAGTIQSGARTLETQAQAKVQASLRKVEEARGRLSVTVEKSRQVSADTWNEARSDIADHYEDYASKLEEARETAVSAGARFDAAAEGSVSGRK